MLDSYSGNYNISQTSIFHFWLILPLGASFALYLTYLLTHQIPRGPAGLYLTFSEALISNGYHIPHSVEYSETIIPFAYPPLIFYIIALLHDAFGLNFVSLVLYLPGIAATISLIPFYYIARATVNTSRGAGIATFIVAVAPIFVMRQLFADGIVTSPARIFVFTGLFFGFIIFSSEGRRYVIPAGVLFGVVLLSHPFWALFFGITFLLQYLYYDRSLGGLQNGVFVAVLGMLIASPWWLTILSVHGPEVFIEALQTGSGGITALFEKAFVLSGLSVTERHVAVLTAWTIPTLGAVYLLLTGRFFLPVWAVVAFLFAPASAVFFILALIGGLFIDEVLLPTFRESASVADGDIAVQGVLAVFLVFGLAIGAVYVSGNSAYSEADAAAGNWVSTETAAESSFVVVGQQSLVEWWPYLSNRKILIGHWGQEWNGPDSYSRHSRLIGQIETCTDAACLTTLFRHRYLTPDYVYIARSDFDTGSVENSDRFSIVYQDDHRIVARYVTD